MSIQYDGTNFSGWVKQTNKKTIQGELESAFSKNAKLPVKLLGASKTDAGVHALDQKVWIELDYTPNLTGLKNTLNKALPNQIFINSIINVDNNFKVRNVKEKTYIYRLRFEKYDVFRQYYTYFWNLPKFELSKLKEVLNLFVGTHDFLNFSGLKINEIDKISPIRTINDIQTNILDSELEIIFKAKGFIRYQIRTIMGCVFAYLNNKISLQVIKETLELKHPKLPYIADAKGLTLISIDY